MSYCDKGITVNDILNNMSENDLTCILTSCEITCNKYYRCDTACLMQDKLKEIQENTFNQGEQNNDSTNR